MTAPPLPTPPRKIKTKKKRGEDAGSRFDERMEDWGARLEASIQKRLLSSIDKASVEASPGPDGESSPGLSDQDIAELESIGATVSGFTKELGSQLSTLFAEIQSEEFTRAVEDGEA